MSLAKNVHREPRRKVFLAAVIGLDKTTTECRIKNLTQTGALIEANSNFARGTTVIINRGELCIAGEVMWSRDNLFGVRFSDEINVQKWLEEPFSAETINTPHKSRSLLASTQLNRSGLDHVAIDENIVNLRLREELLYVTRIIEEVGQILVKDPFLRVRHYSSLQQLDIGKQMLSEIAQLVPMDDKLSHISHIATGPMRGRLLRTNPI